MNTGYREEEGEEGEGYRARWQVEICQSGAHPRTYGTGLEGGFDLRIARVEDDRVARWNVAGMFICWFVGVGVRWEG